MSEFTQQPEQADGSAIPDAKIKSCAGTCALYDLCLQRKQELETELSESRAKTSVDELGIDTGKFQQPAVEIDYDAIAQVMGIPGVDLQALAKGIENKEELNDYLSSVQDQMRLLDIREAQLRGQLAEIEYLHPIHGSLTIIDKFLEQPCERDLGKKYPIPHDEHARKLLGGKAYTMSFGEMFGEGLCGGETWRFTWMGHHRNIISYSDDGRPVYGRKLGETPDRDGLLLRRPLPRVIDGSWGSTHAIPRWLRNGTLPRRVLNIHPHIPPQK